MFFFLQIKFDYYQLCEFFHILLDSTQWKLHIMPFRSLASLSSLRFSRRFLASAINNASSPYVWVCMTDTRTPQSFSVTAEPPRLHRDACEPPHLIAIFISPSFSLSRFAGVRVVTYATDLSNWRVRDRYRADKGTPSMHELHWVHLFSDDTQIVIIGKRRTLQHPILLIDIKGFTVNSFKHWLVV